jgi:hypothetical protein
VSAGMRQPLNVPFLSSGLLISRPISHGASSHLGSKTTFFNHYQATASLLSAALSNAKTGL